MSYQTHPQNTPGTTPTTVTTTAPTTTEPTFKDHVFHAVQSYLSQLDGIQAVNLFQIVSDEMEEPLIRATLLHVRGNQSKAAIILGLSRGTLRKKMKKYGLLD